MEPPNAQPDVPSPLCEICTGGFVALGDGPDGLRLVICPACGLTRVDPIPTAPALADYYARHYAAEFGAANPSDPTFRAAKRLKARNRMEFLAQNATVLPHAPGHLVEIGCAEGEFVGLARRSGWQCSALEPDPALAHFVRHEHGIDVACALFPETRPSTPPGGADAVAAFHVVEHARSPRRFLEGAAALVRPGGLVYVCVPDLLMPGTSLKNPIIRWCHLYYFTVRTLRSMLLACGLEPVRIEACDVCGKPELKALAIAGRRPPSEAAPPDAGAAEEILRRLVA